MQNFIFNAPTNSRDMRKQAIIQQIMGSGAPAPRTAAQGALQGANSIMNGFALRNHNRGPFPDAPGGGRPSFGQGLMNFFGGNGGGFGKGRGGLF